PFPCTYRACKGPTVTEKVHSVKHDAPCGGGVRLLWLPPVRRLERPAAHRSGTSAQRMARVRGVSGDARIGHPEKTLDPLGAVPIMRRIPDYPRSTPQA